jgi:hypothetical protein
MKQPGELTFKITAVFFWVSAFFEITSVSASMPLFGMIVISPAVMLYHLTYLVLFTVLGFGLWFAKGWGYYSLWLTTLIYVTDRIQAALNPELLREFITAQLQDHAEALKLLQIDIGFLKQSGILDFTVWWLQLLAFAMAACWVGFLGYAHLRRRYFGLGDAK